MRCPSCGASMKQAPSTWTCPQCGHRWQYMDAEEFEIARDRMVTKIVTAVQRVLRKRKRAEES